MESATKNVPEKIEQALDQHMETVRRRILERADELAQEEEKDGVVGFNQLSDAIKGYAPGSQLSARTSVPDRVFSETKAFFTSTTVIAAILAVVFGAFGLWAIKSGGIGAENGSGYLDIAKIFAGAVVGSTASTAVSRKRSST